MDMQVLDPRICNAQNNFVCPQVEHMGPDYRWGDPDSVAKITSNRPLSISPNLRAFHLDPATRVTDLISQSYIYADGLLASESFVEAIRGYALQPHEGHPAEVVFRDRSCSYTWLHMTEDVATLIDYSRSEFAVRRPDGGEESTPIEAVDSLRASVRLLTNSLDEGVLIPRRIAFLTGTPRFDLFCLACTALVFFVSDRLAAEFSSRRLDGFDVGPTTTAVTFD